MSPSTPWTEEEISYTYIARLHIKPEMEANFRQALAAMMEVARHDPGTLDYQVFTLPADPYSSFFHETHVDPDADEHHPPGQASEPTLARMEQRLPPRRS